MTFSRRIAAPWGLSPDGRLERNILLSVSSSGLLESVEFNVPNPDSCPMTEYYNGILLPSMVNAHCHLELSHMRGVVPEGIGLTNFFKYVSAGNRDYDSNAVALADKLMWREGVSAVGDVSNTDKTLDLKAASPIRYMTYAEYYGHGCHQDARGYVLHKVGHILAKARALGLDALPAPHSTYLVTPLSFAYAAEMGTLYTHFMESRSECGFFEGHGTMYDYLSLKEPFPYKSAVDMLEKLLPPDTKLTLVHCTCMDEEEIKSVISYFSDVTFVLCPRSNKYIENACPPAKILYNAGCKVAIGTDSLSSNHSLSMAKEIALLNKEYPKIPLATLLSWATAGGASALGYEKEMGYFSKGKYSGVVLATGVDLNKKVPGPDFKLRRIV